MPTRRHVPALVALVAIVALGILASPAAAARRAFVRVTTTCPQDDVNVRFDTSGDVRSVFHRFPGKTVRRLGPKDDNMFLVVRLKAPWEDVKGGAGTNLRLFADGPRTERWAWTFRIVSDDPERDSSNYIACIRPLQRPNVSFLDHMRTNPGTWTWRVEVTAGVVKGAKAVTRVLVTKPR